MPEKRARLSAELVNLSILLYILWLLIPAVQTTGRAMTGAACVALFALGVVLDWTYFKAHWADLCLRALCAAVMPLLLRRFLSRGGTNFAGFYVQQAMFWFPLIYAGYARNRGDRRLWRGVKWALLFAVTLTVCTTIGWLIQGMLRGGKIYAYSRSLGYGGEGREAYLKELMLRNIGGYDFVYAMAASLPLCLIGASAHTGWKRWAFAVLCALQVIMIVLSQYTYAMLFAAAVLAVEGLALVIRCVSRGRITLGKSLLWAVLPFVLAALFCQPLIALAATVCRSIGMNNFAFSFEQLLTALQGGATSADSRLGYYLTAIGGFAQSPVWGDLFGGAKQLSLHSDILDLLSGMGVLGAALVGGMVWLMGRGSLRGVRSHPQRAQLCVSAAVVFMTALLGTAVYSRDILTVAILGAALVLEGEK